MTDTPTPANTPPGAAGLSDAPAGQAAEPAATRQRTCQWFPLCDRPAAGVVHHGPLGDVPVCAEDADRFDLDLRVGP